MRLFSNSSLMRSAPASIGHLRSLRSLRFLLASPTTVTSLSTATSSTNICSGRRIEDGHNRSSSRFISLGRSVSSCTDACRSRGQDRVLAYAIRCTSSSGSSGRSSDTIKATIFADEDEFERSQPSKPNPDSDPSGASDGNSRRSNSNSNSNSNSSNSNKDKNKNNSRGRSDHSSSSGSSGGMPGAVDEEEINRMVRDQLLKNGRPDFSQTDANVNLFQFMEMQKQFMSNPDLFNAEELEHALNERDARGSAEINSKNISSSSSSGSSGASGNLKEEASLDEEEAEFSPNDVSVLSEGELRAVLSNFNLSTEGTKQQLEERLRPVYMDLVAQFQSSVTVTDGNKVSDDVDDGDNDGEGDEDEENDDYEEEYSQADLKNFRNGAQDGKGKSASSSSATSPITNSTSSKKPTGKGRPNKSKIDLEIEKQEREFYDEVFSELNNREKPDIDNTGVESSSSSSSSSSSNSISSISEYEVLSFICSRIEGSSNGRILLKELNLVLSHTASTNNSSSSSSRSYLEIIKSKHETLGNFIEANRDIFEIVGKGTSATLQIRKN